VRPISPASELLEWRVIVQLPRLDDFFLGSPASGLLSHDCEAPVSISLTTRLNVYLELG
jgi:hypothetical protein